MGNPVQLGPGPIARPATPILTTPWVSARRVDYPTAWRMPAGSNPCVSCSLCPDHLAHRRHLGPPTYQTHHCRTSRLTISTAVETSLSLALASHPLSIRHGRVLSVDSGLVLQGRVFWLDIQPGAGGWFGRWMQRASSGPTTAFRNFTPSLLPPSVASSGGNTAGTVSGPGWCRPKSGAMPRISRNRWAFLPGRCGACSPRPDGMMTPS